MEGRVPTRLAAAEGRKFGLTVGAAFLLLGAILLWRGRALAAEICLGLGAALVLGGLVAPARMKPVERAWMAMAHLISRVTTPIAMGIVYFLVVTPSGFVLRKLKGNPLVHADEQGGFWVRRGHAPEEATDMRRQF